MAILQCNKCANLFHDDAPHECDVERWQRLAHEGQQYFGRAIDNAPKPATTEPPEWKGETHVCPFCSATCAVGTFCTCERGQDEMRRWDTIMQAPAQSPLDRALEDFAARRKAKRENGIAAFDNSGPYWACEHCGLLVKANDAAYSAHESGCDARTLSRAMSTPLPHDPDIRTRLMPYRSKEP